MLDICKFHKETPHLENVLGPPPRKIREKEGLVRLSILENETGSRLRILVKELLKKRASGSSSASS